MKRKDSVSTIVLQTTAVILAIFLLRDPIASLLNSILVSPIFSKISDTWSTTLIVIIFCFATLFKVWKTNIPSRHLPIGIITLAFYLIQRFNPYWNFQQVINIEWLYLWDLVIITLIISYVKDLRFKIEKPEDKTNTSVWVEDLPVDNVAQDTFQRRHYAKALAENIQKMNSKRSFAIGILGEYGSGKTSFVNLIKKQLAGAQVDIVEFNAWKSDKAENIQMDFFDHLASELSGKLNNISGLLTSYSRKLSRIDSSVEKFLKHAGIVSQLISTVETETDEYSRINKILESSGRKLIVIIDDLDRLYSNEVVEVLRLVRNTANFTNTFYLMAYEKGYILKAIKEELHVDSSTSFMDKIVQMEVPLPKMEQQSLLDLVKQLLQGRVKKEELVMLDQAVIKYGFNKDWEYTFHNIFRNARDVIKFINSFLVSYDLLKNEVLFDKLFLLELLKYRYPLFYERLYLNRADFLVLANKRKSYKEYYELRVSDKPNLTDEKKRQRFWISDYLEEQKINSDDINLIEAIMITLFNSYSRSVMASYSIIYPSSFERYFRFRLSTNEISEYEFEQSWIGGFNTMSKFITKCAEGKLIRQLINRLFMIEPKTKDDFELLLRSIFKTGPLYKKKIKTPSFDYSSFVDILWYFEGMPAHRFYKDDPEKYQTLLEELFYNAPFPFLFHSELIEQLNDGSPKIPLSKKKLTDYQIIYFCEYAQVKGIDVTAINMMWTCRAMKSFTNQNGVIIDNFLLFDEELKTHVKRFLPTNDLSEFLKGSIKKEHSTRSYTIYPAFLDIFESPDEFRQLIVNDNKTNQEIKEEFLDFFDMLMVIEFKTFIPYLFKTELIPVTGDDD